MKTQQSLFGFLFTSLTGVFLHFLYEWTGGNKLAALVSGVNESTWEHIKLLFVPMFIFAIFQALFLDNKDKRFWCIKLKSILLGMLLIPSIFYTLNGVFGKTPDWINITIFFVSAAAAYIYEARIFNSSGSCLITCSTAQVILSIIAASFIFFTFDPPRIPIFRDPISFSYGITNI